jgi:DNA polymerase III subunit gamma/tau
VKKYIVSARKYRPDTFASVVGQSSITDTLQNALSKEKLAQAFLFCGPRGVGKTTCARILAKTINCLNPTNNNEACNECQNCTSFIEGSSLNIHELDAASHNGVDDIKSLQEQVRMAPQMGDYNVFIIDEVHMLSSSAFNAFLKTLEEPPAHAIFILATTERHKILPTILSRCQIFNFSRISVEDIRAHLQMVCEKEGVQAEEAGLQVIAQKADGALRDSLSLLDQIISFTGGNITYDKVIDNLHVLDYDYYFKVIEASSIKNIPENILTLNQILGKGFDGHNFIVGLGEHVRNLLMCKDARTVKLLETSKDIEEKYVAQATQLSEVFLMNLLNILSHNDTQYKAAKNKRLLLEVMLMQMCSASAEVSNQTDEKKNS